MIGVDYELFWTLNPATLIPFTKAFSMKQEYDDLQAWSLGAYIRLAVASVLSKEVKYPKHPFSQKEKEVPQEVIMDRFLMAMDKINSKFRKEGSSGE
jgi:hypothetical protein